MALDGLQAHGGLQPDGTDRAHPRLRHQPGRLRGWGGFAPTDQRVIRNREVTLVTAADTSAELAIQNDWTIRNTRYADENTRAVWREVPGANVLDLIYTLTPDREMTLNQTAFGGFCVRARNDGESWYESSVRPGDTADPHYSARSELASGRLVCVRHHTGGRQDHRMCGRRSSRQPAGDLAQPALRLDDQSVHRLWETGHRGQWPCLDAPLPRYHLRRSGARATRASAQRGVAPRLIGRIIENFGTFESLLATVSPPCYGPATYAAIDPVHHERGHGRRLRVLSATVAVAVTVTAFGVLAAQSKLRTLPGVDSSNYIPEPDHEGQRRRTSRWRGSIRYAAATFSPVVADGVLYGLGRNSASLVALDAATGKEIWVHEGLNGIVSKGINYWQSDDGKDRRLLFSVNSFLQAIDARTGKSIMTFGKNGIVDLRVGLRRAEGTVRARSRPVPAASGATC